jgi:L-threonylcarbamoyladenylate synthase
VYGLAADASNPAAVAKIFVAKGRPSNHPLIVHIASSDDLNYWADDIPEIAYKLADAFWPGPLTLLLKKSARVSGVVTGGLSTIGIRVPNHPMFLKLLAMGGAGYAAPSANLFKQLEASAVLGWNPLYWICRKRLTESCAGGLYHLRSSLRWLEWL